MKDSKMTIEEMVSIKLDNDDSMDRWNKMPQYTSIGLAGLVPRAFRPSLEAQKSFIQQTQINRRSVPESNSSQRHFKPYTKAQTVKKLIHRRERRSQTRFNSEDFDLATLKNREFKRQTTMSTGVQLRASRFPNVSLHDKFEQQLKDAHRFNNLDEILPALEKREISQSRFKQKSLEGTKTRASICHDRTRTSRSINFRLTKHDTSRSPEDRNLPVYDHYLRRVATRHLRNQSKTEKIKIQLASMLRKKEHAATSFSNYNGSETFRTMLPGRSRSVTPEKEKVGRIKKTRSNFIK